jgi:hypothetical protein
LLTFYGQNLEFVNDSALGKCMNHMNVYDVKIYKIFLTIACLYSHPTADPVSDLDHSDIADSDNIVYIKITSKKHYQPESESPCSAMLN